MRTYTFGIYPRPYRLIAATRSDPEGARGLARDLGRAIIEAQARAGLSFTSDPMLEWDDMLRWFALEWEGIEVDGITRYFERNMFYRTPVVKSAIRAKGGALKGHVDVEALRSSGRALVEVPEPVTFALMSKDEHYGGVDALSAALARALNEEICAAVEASGAKLIVVKGPALVHTMGQGHLELAARASEALLDSCDAPAILHLYFKGPLGAFSSLRRIPSAYSGFGLDATRDAPGAISRALEGYDRDYLALGVLNSQNTRVEGAGELRKLLAKMGTDAVGSGSRGTEVLATASSDLEFVPYGFAMKKIRALGAISRDG